MTHHEEHLDATADAKQAKNAHGDDHGSHADPQPANVALPDGQFDDQKMPTTDGEPADDSATGAGAESQEEGDAAMRAAEEATKDS